jgi:hypothetical protein
MRLLPAFVLLALARVAGAADQPEVISVHRDAVSVTIYRDLFALITETRTVDLPAGPATLAFDDVVETILPQSAVVSDLGRPLAENNYDFQQLTPSNLLLASIGKNVTLTRTHQGTGKVTEVRATVVSAGTGGVVFQTADGAEALRCSGLPERLSFDEVPSELHAHPRLSVRIASGTAGRRTVKLSYLAHGFAWNADYVASTNATSERMDLSGWITLENMTGASFSQAQVQVVAGKLNLLGEEDGGTGPFGPTAEYSDDAGLDGVREETRESMREELASSDSELALLDGCFASPAPHLPAAKGGKMSAAPQVAAAAEMEEIVMVTGFRASMAVRESLADYQMYRLPWPTDLAARQSKQALFLRKQNVRIRRFYTVKLEAGGTSEDEPFSAVGANIAWINKQSEGLGEPMPGGVVRFFDPFGAGRIFAGEARLEDRPVGTPVELLIGLAPDVAAEVIEAAEPRENTYDLRVRLTNAKALMAPIEVRQQIEERFQLRPRIRVSNAPAARKDDYFVWKLRVPPGSEQWLSYRFQWDERD